MTATPSTRSVPSRLWVEMTSPQFSSLPVDTVAILPVAAIEQHGPHLPVYVDACLNAGVVERAMSLVAPEVPAVFLPMQAIGKSNEHQAFPGTLTLRAETLIALLTDIGESVHRAGLRKLVLFNSHGGQPQVMDIVARDLRVRLGMFVVCAATWSFGWPDRDAFSETERIHGIHGGGKETSMMLALRPDLVRMELAGDFTPASVAIEQRYKHLRAEGKVGFGWQAQDLHPSGASGNALDADAGRGAAIVEHAASGLAELIAEVHAYPLDAIRSMP
ncbi:creatininase family protein [Bordetella genomosp. 8]|nr:creatininase family protein [Bordetella genomosp. 8]